MDLLIGSGNEYLVKIFANPKQSQEKFIDALYRILLVPKTQDLAFKVISLLMNFLIKSIYFYYLYRC